MQQSSEDVFFNELMQIFKAQLAEKQKTLKQQQIKLDLLVQYAEAAHMAEKAKNYEAAINFFELAIDLDENYVHGCERLAIHYHRLGRFADEKRVILRGIEMAKRKRYSNSLEFFTRRLGRLKM